MIELKATPRETDRKSTLKALRKEGKIPAVIYGKKVVASLSMWKKRHFSNLNVIMGCTHS